MTSIAASGLSGLVGSRLVELKSDWSFEAFGIADPFYEKLKIASFENVDITDADSVDNFLSKSSAEWVLHLAAITDVDGCEREKDRKEESLSWKVNVEGTRNVAKSCQKYSKKLILISTETVFGDKKGPFDENEKLIDEYKEGGVSWYGFTKAQAEKVASEENPEVIIIRISYPYRANFKRKGDFARNIIDKFENGSIYPLYDDQYLTPTFIDDLAMGLETITNKDLNGVFHIASTDVTTPYDFGIKLVTKFFGKDQALKVEKTAFENKLGLAPRPKYGGLKINRIIETGFTPKNTDLAINELYKQRTA